MSSRQKKLEKKKAKRTEKKKALTRVSAMSVPERMQNAAAAPILDCAILSNEGPEPLGLVQLLFSRRLPSGEVAMAFWLIDMDLLGLKNGWGAVVSYGRYKEIRENIEGDYERHPIDPPSARKLVDEAIAYARKFEFEPHAEARKALPLLGDIDAGQSSRQFTFGQDGKPFYVSGPNESLARRQQIVQQLERTAGPGNYDYMVGVDGIDEIVNDGVWESEDDSHGHIHGPDCDHDHDHSHDHDH